MSLQGKKKKREKLLTISAKKKLVWLIRRQQQHESLPLNWISHKTKGALTQPYCVTAVDWLCGPAGAELGSSPRFFSSSSSLSFSFPIPLSLMAGPSSGTLSASLQNTNAAVTISTDGLRLSSDPVLRVPISCYGLNLRQGFFFPSLLHLCSVHHSFSASSNLMHQLFYYCQSRGCGLPTAGRPEKTYFSYVFLRNTFSKKSHQLACSCALRVSSLCLC